MEPMVTRKLRRAKGEHHLSFTFGLAGACPDSGKYLPRLDSPCDRSRDAQFQDRPGACKLIETAVSRGDQTMTRRLADCRAS